MMMMKVGCYQAAVALEISEIPFRLPQITNKSYQINNVSSAIEMSEMKNLEKLL